ncbi:2TM domain-containing protein [Ewingella americana]|nr:2TM domain-containing protein [Ewingella americana]
MMNQNRIKQLRLSRAWSQEQLAELTSLSVRTIQRIENGEQASLETLGALAAAFDIKVADLVGEQGAASSPDNALDLNIEAARHQVRSESRFYRGMIIYLLVSVLLIVICRVTSPEYNWFWWPVGIWGGLMVVRGLRVFVLRGWFGRWEQARLQKILRK